MGCSASSRDATNPSASFLPRIIPIAASLVMAARDAMPNGRQGLLLRTAKEGQPDKRQKAAREHHPTAATAAPITVNDNPPSPMPMSAPYPGSRCRFLGHFELIDGGCG